MLAARIIPSLLVSSGGLVKTTKFSKPKYIGDPINAIKIFNEKEVDELILLDIDSTRLSKKPNFKLIEEIAGECFMPLSYGGGINAMDDIKTILSIGVEKVIINTAAINNPSFIQSAVKTFGGSTIVISIDYKNNFFKKPSIYTKNGSFRQKIEPLFFAKKMQELGVGEIIFNSIERDGTMSGFDTNFIKKAVDSLNIPVIASGGAGSLKHLKELIKNTSISAIAAGSLFVYYGPNKGILINYPSHKSLKNILN